MNISVLKTKFILLISGQNFNTINNIAYVKGGKAQLYFIFEHYHYKTLCFWQLSIYKYEKVISFVKYKQKQENDYKFDDIHT